ncbi:MAG: FkbM family methyltransferase [Actinomycetota bacterium]
MVRKRVLVGPEVRSMDDFAQVLARLGHYLGYVDPERVVLLVAPAILDDAKAFVGAPRAPRAFDPDVLEGVNSIASSIELLRADTDLSAVVMTTDLLLVWDNRCVRNGRWAKASTSFRRNRTFFDVDWVRTRGDGSWFAEGARQLSRSRSYDPEEQRLFRARTGRLRGADKAYLVATGPSARMALDMDLDDGLTIACNTVVLDDELMEHSRPDILTFADPIFHFGPSTYAHEFQRALRKQAAIHDFTIVTMERYADLLRSRMPELEGRIVGVRMGKPEWPQNLNLWDRLSVRPYPNILTMLMLPLAATFSRSIGMVGFDGRAPDETYFWRHGSTVQFAAELEDIRDVHPGFFELDYGDYYDEHVGALESLIQRCERIGTEVGALTPSFMAPLRRRPATDGPAAIGAPPSSDQLVISVTPDWVDEFGHFGPWERRLGSAVRSAGMEHRALSSLALQSDSELVVPTFADGTYGTGPAVAERFEEQLAAALEPFVQPGRRISVGCYTADVWHLAPMLSVARRFPDVRFHINLMRSHPLITEALTGDDGWVLEAMELLRTALDAAEGTNVVVTLDTEAIVGDVRLVTGHTVPVWPMFMVAEPEALVRADAARGTGGPVRIVSPAQPQDVKGFPQVVELTEALAGKVQRGEVSVVTRSVPQPTGKRAVTAERMRRFEAAGGELVLGNLSDEGYADLVGQADIVLIPYRYDPFRTRTSGVVLDAIVAGKPVVAVRGTWAGNLVERLGVGLTYNDGDVRQFVEVVEQAISKVKLFREQALEVRDEVVAEFQPDRLVEFLTSPPDGEVAPPTREAVDRVRRQAVSLFRTHASRLVREETHAIRHVSELDDKDRQADALRDRIESLDRAVAWRDAKLKPKSTSPSSAPAKLRTPLRSSYSRSAKAHLDELELVAELVRPATISSGLMVDVGAHHGSAFRSFRNAGWTILAFEPDRRHRRYLEERFGNDPRVVLDGRAVSDTTGDVVTFYTSEESTGVSGLQPFLDSHVEAGRVETVALRDVLDVERVDLLKVDTEGHERSVLEGFPWDRYHPDVVVCEFEDLKTKPLGYDTGDLAKMLVDQGYQVWVSEWHPVVRYGIRHDWHRLVRYPVDLASEAAWGNLMAFAAPVSDDVMREALARIVDVGEVSDAAGDAGGATPTSLVRRAAASSAGRSARRQAGRVARRLHLPTGRIKGVARRVL